MTLYLQYFFNLGLLAGALYLVYRSLSDAFLTKMYLPLLGAKVLASMAFALTYYFYYQEGDTIRYFQDAAHYLDLALGEHWQWLSTVPTPDQEVRRIFFTKVVSALLRITQSDFWLANLYFAVVGFLALLYLLQTFTRPVLYLLAFGAVPSVLFWTSGLLKEGLVYPSLVFLLGALLRITQNRGLRWWEVILVAISIYFLIVIKYYIAAVCLPLMTYVLLDHFLAKTQWIPYMSMRLAVLSLLLLGPTYFLLSSLHPHLSWNSLAQLMTQGSEFLKHGPPSDSDWQSGPIDYWEWPGHLWTGLARPIFPERMSFPGIFAGLENLVLLVLSIWKVVNYKQWNWHINAQTLAAWTYALVLAFFLAASAPTEGALARYKIYYLPLLWFWALNHAPVLNTLHRIRRIRDFI